MKKIRNITKKLRIADGTNIFKHYKVFDNWIYIKMVECDNIKWNIIIKTDIIQNIINCQCSRILLFYLRLNL